VHIIAGGTNTSGGSSFQNGASLNANVTITYTGLEIKGGSGDDSIENDAKNGVVTDGNGNDNVILNAPNETVTLGTGSDSVAIGFRGLGTPVTAGAALGDKVTFGSAATSELVLGFSTEAGMTAGTANIGLTKVVKAAAGMEIDFTRMTTSSNIVDETAAVASAPTLTAAENAAVKAMAVRV
jgi:hypothetical protein